MFFRAIQRYFDLERAAALGCPHKSSSRESKDKLDYVLQYPPKDQTQKNWKQRYTVTMRRVPSDNAVANKATSEIIMKFKADLQKAGTVIKYWAEGTENTGPVAYGEYTVDGQWNSMAIGRTGPGITTTHQLTVRSGQPTSGQIKIIKDMVGL